MSDDQLLTDVDAFDISGPPRMVDGRWQGGIGPGVRRATTGLGATQGLLGGVGRHVEALTGAQGATDE